MAFFPSLLRKLLPPLLLLSPHVGCNAERIRDQAVPWIRGTLEGFVRKWMIRQSGALPELWGDMCDAVAPIPGGYLAGLGFDVGLFDFDASHSVRLLSRDHAWGFVHDIALKGDVAYVAAGGSGLSWIDLRRPSKIRQAGPFGVNGYALTMRIRGETGYLGYKDGGGLLLLDLAQRGKPAPRGRLFVGEDVSDIEIFGDTAAVGVSNRIEILSIRGDGGLSPVASVPLPRHSEVKPIDPLPRDIAAKPPYLFVANGPEGLVVLDISQLTAPQSTATLSGHGFFESIVVVGDRAYVGRKGEAVGIIDVSRPERSRWKGEIEAYGRTLPDPEFPSRFIVAGGAKGWSVWTAEEHPTKVLSYSLPPRAYDVEPAGEVLYVAAAGEGVKVLRERPDGGFQDIGRLPTPGNAHQVRIDGRTLLISDSIGGFLFAGLDEMGIPRFGGRLDQYDVGNHVWAALKVPMGLLLADGQHGLSLFFPHPAPLPRAGEGGWRSGEGAPADELFLNGYAVDLEPYMDYLYVATIGAGVAVVKHEGTTLRLVRTLKPSRFPPRPYTALAIAGNRLLIGDPMGSLHVYDLADPSDPKPLGRTRIGGAVFDIEARGDTVWAAAHKRGLVELALRPDGRLKLRARHFEGRTVMGVGLSDRKAFAAVEGGVRSVSLQP